MTRYVVRTLEGTLANGGREMGGLDKQTAEADAARRTQRAEEMGLQVRYEAQPVDESEVSQP